MLRNVLSKNGLSNRECEVAGLVATGISNREVADKLFVTEKTIKFHLTNIYKKMSIRSRAQLIVWCLPHLHFIEKEREAQQAAAPAEIARPTPVAAVPERPSTIEQPSAATPDQRKESDNVMTLATGFGLNRGPNVNGGNSESGAFGT